MADNTNILPNDQNFVRAAGFESSTNAGRVVAGQIIEATGRVKVDMAGGSLGTVTDVSVVTANGFAGTVATSTTTPAITISTTINSPVLAGNGTAISAATTTGSGSTVVLSSSPTLTSPVLGAATATSINGLTITASTGTLTITNLKTLAVSNTLTFTGTDSSSVAFGTGGTVLYSASTIPLTVGSTTIASGATTRILYDNAGVLGEYTISGSGTVVAMAASPVFTAPTLGAALATSINGNTFTTGTYTLTGTAGKTLNFTNTLTLSGTDSTTMTFPSTSATVARTDAANTFTGVQTITNLTLPTNGQILLTNPSSGGNSTGPTTSSFNSGYSSTAIGDLMYLDSSATWQKADADASATTYNGLLGVALSVAASAAPVLVALPGSFIFATAWNLATVGAPIYMSATAGAITLTAPVTTDSATRIIGWVLASGNGTTKIFFNPSDDYITHT